MLSLPRQDAKHNLVHSIHQTLKCQTAQKSPGRRQPINVGLEPKHFERPESKYSALRTHHPPCQPVVGTRLLNYSTIDSFPSCLASPTHPLKFQLFHSLNLPRSVATYKDPVPQMLIKRRGVPPSPLCRNDACMEHPINKPRPFNKSTIEHARSFIFS